MIYHSKDIKVELKEGIQEWFFELLREGPTKANRKSKKEISLGMWAYISGTNPLIFIIKRVV